jgi:hypothetical protein
MIGGVTEDGILAMQIPGLRHMDNIVFRRQLLIRKYKLIPVKIPRSFQFHRSGGKVVPPQVKDRLFRAGIFPVNHAGGVKNNQQGKE